MTDRRQGPWFLQTDPVGYKADVDLYAYADEDPVKFADPSGLPVDLRRRYEASNCNSFKTFVSDLGKARDAVGADFALGKKINSVLSALGEFGKAGPQLGAETLPQGQLGETIPLH